MADVFISYSRADQELVQSLAESLQAEGLSVWWDRNIGGGAEFASAIERELSAAKAVVAGLSGFHRWYSGYVSYAAGDYEDALPHLKAQGRLTPSWAACHALTAISCFILGDEDEARKYIAKAKDPNPHLRPDRLTGIVRTQQDRDKGAREYGILEQLWHEDSEPKTQS